ncbi:unnamed protein product [Symbiodinium microadriaticum]|nr:unnamed protein product [Symbiodinium microadriaticum]
MVDSSSDPPLDLEALACAFEQLELAAGSLARAVHGRPGRDHEGKAEPRELGQLDFLLARSYAVRQTVWSLPLRFFRNFGDFKLYVGRLSGGGRPCVPGAVTMDRLDLVCASSGVVAPYVASAPIAALPRDKEAQVLCVPVLLRPGGFLLALPTGSVPPALLAAGAEPEAVGMHGPSTTLEVAAVEEDEDGSERPVSDTLSVLLVDLADEALKFLVPYDSEAGLSVVSFDPVHPDRFPSAEDLLVLARSWLRAAAHDRAAFYTAAEEEKEPREALGGDAPVEAPTGQKPPKPKRVTTGQLANQLSALLEVKAGAQVPPPPVPALQQPFQIPKGKEAPGMPSSLANVFGPPPKVRHQLSGPPPQVPSAGDGLARPPMELETPGQVEGEVSAALTQQSNALTMLVTHLISQASEASADFGGGSSGSGLSSKGSARREKLQAELANYTGAFMLSVAQAGARRMNPTAPPPRSLAELRSSPAPFRFTEYVERYGGYQHQRELGLIQYMLCQVTDLLLSGEVDGTLDLLSLMHVAVEQAAQDHGKWEVAYVLSLFPDPPGQVFQSRSSAQNPRLKAWAPLCPAPWATTALAYLKEADAIMARRSEAVGVAQPKKPADQEAPRALSLFAALWGPPGLSPDPAEAPGLDLLPGSCQPASCNSSHAAPPVEAANPDANAASPAVLPGSALGDFIPAATPPAGGLSFKKWSLSLAFRILRTRTPFAAFLAALLHLTPGGKPAPANALFPLPLPFFGQFSRPPPHLGSRARLRLGIRRATFVTVAALNYVHAGGFASLASLRRPPNGVQRKALHYLGRLVKACGAIGEVDVPSASRRSAQLLARLGDLSEELTYTGLASDGYGPAFPGASLSEEQRGAALAPYRSLDADRLKLSGKANWDPSPYLHDALYLAFREPDSLLRPVIPKPSRAEVPASPEHEVGQLCKVAGLWDANDLLFLSSEGPSAERPYEAVRLFNCLKNSTTDRQIADRRGRNHVEGIVPGPSREIPTGPSLQCLYADPARQSFQIWATDRKDWYHQLLVPPRRSVRNVLVPPLEVSKLADTRAFRRYLASGAAVPSPGSRLHLGFRGILQGDALGVEFACSSHCSLLQCAGLLSLSTQLCGSRPPPLGGEDSIIDGLVIDDYYAISVHPDGDASPSQAELAFRTAKATYARAGIIGSDDKDVRGEDLAVCTGAEIDGSPATRSLGLALVGAPRQKRVALAAISLEVARLPCTTDHLHLSLLGGWTSILLYKRPLMSIVSEAYHLVDATKVRPQVARTVPLPRAVANELSLLSALCHVLVADVSSDWLPEIFATDSSEEKGAIVKADLGRDASKVLWGASLGPSSSARLQSKERAALMRVDRFCEELLEEPPKAAPKRPLALRLHFLEVCAAPAGLTQLVGELGWKVGPVLSPRHSPEYDLAEGRPPLGGPIIVGTPEQGSSAAGEGHKSLEVAKVSSPSVSVPCAILMLFLLVSGYKPPVLTQHRCSGLSFRAFVPPCLDFDATLGYPGEGPAACFWALLFLGFRAKGVSVGASHGLLPRNSADIARQAKRGRAVLPQGRGVEQKTEARRETLWASFLEWLEATGVDNKLFTQRDGFVDIDAINAVLSKYGRELYANGRPFSHFSETINAFAAKTPKCRRLLQPAWDTAFGWRRAEPIQHHAAMPWQVLCSCVALAFLWGWPLVAGALALCWGGLLRPGELIAAHRSDLVLPGDIECSMPFAWFSIREPKTRYTAARHQSVKIDHPDILNVISIAYAPLLAGSKLWPSSGQTLRTRLRQLLGALKIPAVPTQGALHLELASLRAGGASWMMLVCEDPGLVQRRGRWLSARVFEIYIQEVGTLQFIPALPAEARYRIRRALDEYHTLVQAARFLQNAGIAPKNWFSLFAARMHA